MNQENQNGNTGVLTAVEYQEASIVSKLLMKGNSGSVTVFAFDKDQELTEHTSNQEAFIHVMEGIVGISIGGKKHQLGTNQSIQLPAGIPHAVKAISKFKMLLVMFQK